MPLKDLFAKTPPPLPPSEEPWPRSETSREKFRQSSLHSATARPTLDEFLRTNYLMIPDFLLKVTHAKVAARTGKSNHDFQSAISEQSMLTFGTVQGRGTSSAAAVSSFNIVSNADKEVKFIKGRGTQEKEATESPKIRSTKNTDMPCTVLSRKQSCEEIQVPPPLKPKPRVKKVMRGGSLVTIPPPQPRCKARQEPVEDGGKSTSSVTDVCLMSRPEGRDDPCDVSERGIQETVENASVKETNDGQELAKNEGSVNFGCEADNFMTEDPSWDIRGLGTEILTEDCEQTQNPLISCDTAVPDTCKSHNTSYGNSNGNFDEPDRNTCSIDAVKADKSIVLLSQDTEVILEKGSEKESNKNLQGESTSGPKSDSDRKAAIAKESEVISEDPRLSRNLDRTPPALDPEEMTICKDPLEETKTEPRPQGTVGVDSQRLTMDDHITMEKSADLPQNVVTNCSISKQSPVSYKEDKSAGKLSEECTNGSNPSENFDNDKAIDKKDNDSEVISGDDEQNVPANGTEEITDISVKGCDDTAVNDNDDKKNSSASSSSPGDEEEDDNDGDDVDDDSDDDDDDDDDDAVKDNPADDRSDEYAELVMDDSTSEGEDEEYDVYPVNDSDSDEEGELKSDYEAEDMNLDSDTESATGGITSYQDTTIGARVKQSRRKLQRDKRRAKNKKKKASKKRAKAAKQAAKGHVQNRNHNPSERKKDFKGKQTLTPTSQKAGTKLESMSRGPGTGDKSTAAALKFEPGTPKLPPNNPPKESTLEDGSLLSMVSSFAVDLTVAANEKLFLAKRRGGQHSKKMKKAKRKAEALERIRRGDPPPRTARRVFAELPKPICSFYREGKCRKGSDCSFRHDRSALIKKKEICKFYMHSADNCFAGEDCIFMHSSFPCKFFHTSRCRDGDRCRFSHDPLTEETDRLLQAFLNPPTEDSTPHPQEKNLATSSQQPAGGNSRDEDTSQALNSSSPYNLRASARKRTLGSDETGTEGGFSIGGKIAKQESPGNDQDSKEAQSCAFFPGLYRDLSA